jgi:hypothetical protein
MAMMENSVALVTMLAGLIIICPDTTTTECVHSSRFGSRILLREQVGELIEYSYLAFGLNVESQFSLSGVPEGSSPDLPKVSIQKARPDFDWAGLLDDADAGDNFAGVLNTGQLRYAVLDGESITFQPSKGVSRSLASFMMETMATGSAFAILLRQRGFLALHAAVLRKGEYTIAFVGDSGYGKSTLAEFFSQAGYQVLSDDIGAVRVMGSRVTVVPGYPIIKLRSASVNSLLPQEGASQYPMMDGRTYVAKENAGFEPVKLNRLYLLTDSFSAATRIRSVNVQRLVFHLVQRTHGSKHLVRNDYQSRLLQQCATVAGEIPARILERKEGLRHLHDAIRVVEDDLGGA